MGIRAFDGEGRNDNPLPLLHVELDDDLHEVVAVWRRQNTASIVTPAVPVA
jgi:hypothetical protein